MEIIDNKEIIKVIISSGTEKPYYLRKEHLSAFVEYAPPHKLINEAIKRWNKKVNDRCLKEAEKHRFYENGKS